MATRSEIIKGRILRNLKRHGAYNSDVLDPEIYGEMNNAVNHIFSESNPDKEITITLEEDQKDYPLTTQTVTDPALYTYLNNIASVKVVKQPETFLYPFIILTNKDFADIVSGRTVNYYGLCSLYGTVDFSTYIVTQVDLVGNKDGSNTIFYIPEDLTAETEEIFFNGVLQIRDTDYTIANKLVTIISGLIPVSIDTLVCNYIKNSAFGSNIVNTYQPLIGTIIDKRLQVYPVPNADYADLEIELMVYLKSSDTIIDKDTNPDPDPEYDKALELYATAQFLSNPDRSQYMNEFKQENLRLRPLLQRKHHNISRPKVM